MLRTALLSLLAATPLLAADRPPNIVFIYADDMGYADAGCYGNKLIRTPYLDKLAADGVRFTDFYVAQAVCSASRTALLTGCYPNRLGILGALNPNSKNGIHDRETTIAMMLKPKGYATAIFGKWHLGHYPQFLPTHHGFDEYFGLPYSNDMLPRAKNKFPELPLIEGDKTIETSPDVNQLTRRYTEHAVSFIERNKDKPFFLYVPHTMPHVPLGASEKFRGKSKAGLYGDVIEEIDWSIGEIVAALAKHGLEKNTLVMFSSDNGPWLTYGNHGGSADSLREGKGTTFEGGVREPFIARWPGKIPAGTVCHEPAMTIDILPTIAAFTGAELPKLKIDGEDIGKLLTEPTTAKSPQEAYYFYWGQELQAVRSGKWKLHFPHDYQALKEKGGDGKPGQYVKTHLELSLFDLENDVGEAKNVAAANPDVVARLTGLADTVRQDLGDVGTKIVGKGVRPAAIVQPPK
jgi:arylsulfatase A-like enzyme